MTADAPVGTIFNCCADAFFTPFRNEAHGVECLQGLGAGIALIQSDKPLIHGAENNGRFGAPAVRIAVIEIAQFEQVVRLPQKGQYRLIGRRLASFLQHADADQAGGDASVIKVTTIVIQWTIHFEPVFESTQVVIQTMTRGDVHATCARFGGHVFGGDNAAFAFDERMPCDQSGEFSTLEACAFADIFQSAGRGEVFRQSRGDDVHALIAGECHVVQIWVHRHRKVGGQGPRGGGPNDNCSRCRVQANFVRGFSRQRKAYIDRGTAVVAVFDFGFRQGRAAGDGPINGLLAAVNQTLFDKSGKGFQFLALIGGINCPIGLIPIAEHAEAFELFGLHRAELGGKGSRGFTHFADRVVALALFL